MKFSGCAVIIDCSEIFMERPTNLIARAQVWSNYKPSLELLHKVVSKCYGEKISGK